MMRFLKSVLCLLPLWLLAAEQPNFVVKWGATQWWLATIDSRHDG